MMFDPLIEKSLYRATIPQIILIDTDRSIEEQFDEAFEVERLMRMVIEGRASLWEVFEQIETLEFDIDQYIDEVEENLNYELSRGFKTEY